MKNLKRNLLSSTSLPAIVTMLEWAKAAQRRLVREAARARAAAVPPMPKG